jgi:hypothetical protein
MTALDIRRKISGTLIMRARLTEWLRSKIAKDLGWSIAGTVLPLAVAVLAIPLLISGIGLQKFGLLTLAWVVVGYFSLFDLGLGRAMTLQISQKQAAGQDHEIPSVVWLGMGLMTVLGAVGGLFFGLLAPWIVEQKFAVPSELYPELRSTIILLALSIPMVIVSTGLRGILEAKRRFDIINLVRIPQGVMSYLGPLAMLPFSDQLPHLVATLVVVGCAHSHLFACLSGALRTSHIFAAAVARDAILRRLDYRQQHRGASDCLSRATGSCGIGICRGRSLFFSSSGYADKSDNGADAYHRRFLSTLRPGFCTRSNRGASVLQTCLDAQLVGFDTGGHHHMCYRTTRFGVLDHARFR